uniref:Calponin-homology (CH) domain-containing protein n=1 Tax=Strigamia maritima TaxID=126957 RepID=T1JAS5_STRMM
MANRLALLMKQCTNYHSPGLQLIPSVFEFSDPQAGVTYKKSMKFTNLSKRPIRLLFKNRIDNQAFQLHAPTDPLILPSGLTVTILLEFTCKNCLDEIKSSLIVYVSDEPLAIPILVQNSKPSMDVTRFVDFGKVIADGRIIISKLYVSNWGEKLGNCYINYTGSPLICIHEMTLSVPPNLIREVAIELRAFKACKLREILKVKLEGRCVIDVQVWAETVEPSLQLLNEKTKENIKCIKFGSVYYGSMALSTALLYNNSPEHTSFITVLDVSKKILSESNNASSSKDKLLDPTNMFSVMQNEGTLRPYEYTRLYFKFSPRFLLPKRAWTCLEKFHQPPRKDYTVYVSIQPVGLGGTLLAHNRKNEIEVGCIATVLPIDVCFYPNRVHFEVKTAGEIVEKKVKFTNMSAILPLHFCIKPAGFIRTKPKEGVLKPHEMVEILVTIKPDHFGKFKAYIPFDIYGYTCDDQAPNDLIFTPINTLYYECIGLVHVIEQSMKPKSDIVIDVEEEKAVLVSTKKQKSSPSLPQLNESTERSFSVKSLNQTRVSRTIFTRTRKHKASESDKKLKFLHQGDARTKIKPEEMKFLSKEDMGIVPHAGLKSPDIHMERDFFSDEENQFLSTLEAKKNRLSPDLNMPMTKFELSRERESIGLKAVSGGLKTYPETSQEKVECKLRLTPSQVYLVIVGPAYLNFGDVCENSTNTSKLLAMNCLTNHVLISFVLSCCEVKFGCPLTMVLPPKSHTEIPIDFEPKKLENFHKSIKYFINCCHEGHIVVAARVVKPMLIFHPRHLVIEANLTRNAVDGYHAIVTLTNPLNHPAKFEWQLYDEEESPYNISPKTGYVDAYCSIDCEVVYSLAKDGFEGQFILNVEGGEESILECHAQLDPAKVIAVDENIGLGPLAFHLPIEKMCILKNTGMCHAFYQMAAVQMPSPSLTPAKGILSAMDLKELKLRLCPDVMGKVDQRLYLNIKNGKTVEFKITGQVEPPLVEMSQNTFNFRTVPCGGWKSLPCVITNKGKTRAELEFDFRGYVDFSVIFHRQKGVAVSNPLETKDVQKVYKTEILSGEAINVEICFHPVELAAYDFTLTLDINKISSFLNYDKKVSIVKMSQSKKTDAGKLPGGGKVTSDHYAMKKTLTSYEISLPLYHISAVAIPQMISIIPPKVRIEMKKKAKMGFGSAVVKVTNLTDKTLPWFLNVSQCSPPMDEPIFLFIVEQETPDKFNIGCELSPGGSINMRISFHPVEAGVLYRCKIPIIVRTMPHPVGFLSIEGILLVPKLIINPPEIILPIVPLNITVHAQFYLNLFDHETISITSVDYPRLPYFTKTGAQDDTWPAPHLEVLFPNGNTVRQNPSSTDQKCSLAMLLSFRSLRPVFFSTVVLLKASDGNQFPIPISGGSENCMLTSIFLLQQWRPSIHISLPDSDVNPELMALVCSITNTTAGKSISSDSSFDLAKSEYHSSDSVTIISFDSGDSSSITTIPTSIDQRSLFLDESSSDSTSSSSSVCRVTVDDPLTVIVERWFSVHGFPSGMYPIKLPESMTRALFYTQMQESRTLKLAPLSKLYSTIFDCIHTLTGRMVLTNVKITLSVDPVERANQLHSQTDCLIRFLQAQNGCLSGIKPEYLLSYKNYLIWLRYKSSNESLKVYPPSSELDRDAFREISTRCWTQYLLQIYKTLVLYRICRQTYSSIEIPRSDGSINSISLIGITQFSSNLYSSSERIILIWLNKLYESELDNLSRLTVGEKPTKRWIINFDTNLMDSLPFAAIFSAYASIIIENKLRDMYGRPTTPEQIRHNATRIVSMLEDLGKEYDIKATDIINPHPVAMLMFSVFLFERIPNLLPKATILFRGYLNVPVIKQMILTNPGTKIIGFKTVIAGPGKRNYMCTHSQFTIAPNGKFSISIECRNKHINPGPAVVHLQAKRIGPTPGTSLVFNLDAKLTYAQPVDIINIDSNCYDQKLKVVRIKNSFNEGGIFNISLHECMYKEDELAYNPENQCELIRFFHCSKSEIFLDPKGSTDLNILFTPLLMNKRQCFIIFSNEKIGDFIYSIVGDVSLPSQMPYTGDIDMMTGKNAGEEYLKGDGIIHVNCTVGDNCIVQLPIPFENVVLTKALVQASQMYLTSPEYVKRQGTDTLETESLLNMFSALLYNYASDVLPNEYLEKTDANEKLFQVEMDCEKFEYSISHKVVAPDYKKPCPFSKHPRCMPNKDVQQYSNLLIIKIQPIVHGYVLSRLILKSPRDIRVYQIQLCVNSKIPLAFLEFSTPAHQAIAQDIPITNITTFDWSLTAHIEGRGFSGPQKLDVPSHSSQNYSLVFWPMKESTVEGSLKFVNEFDGMEYNFNLLGKALHPYPFVSHTFLCQARQMIRKDIEVPNITLKKFTFQVESDLIFLSGPPTISVPPLCKGIYPLEIYCLTSGHFAGTLSFRVIPTDHEIDSDGDELEDGAAIQDDSEDWIGYIVWASLDITASPAAAEKSITISCNLMESTILDTTIRNPTIDLMLLSVQIEGEGLSGSNIMQVASGKKEVYRLTYTPLRIGHADGRTITETLVLKNCCNEQVSVDVLYADTLNYTFGEGEVVLILPPSSEVPVVYRFTPSGIQRFKNKFTFSSRQLGDIIFYVQGIGLYPADTINIYINTPLGMTNSYTINFLNPTVFDANAKITFKEPGRDRSDTCFTIPLEHLEGIFLKGRAEFQIPIFFRARHMREYKAMLLVSLQRADKKLWLFLDQDKEQPKEVVWTYHIYGIPEYTIDRKQRILKCQAKKVLVEQLALHLHHCVPPSSNQGISLGSERFTYQIQVPGKESLLNNFTKVSLDRESWDCKSNVAELVFRIEFFPLVTMKVNAPFTIRSTAGGIWKLPLSFIATEPDADNNIVIKAIDSDPKFNIYEIRLRSPTERAVPFHAYFLPKSDNDFKIYPESGMLPGINSEPLKITVAYIPKNYVKVSKAKLMIQAEECEWLYDILGYPPQYKPPVTQSVT